jgi:predicted nucleic acid-binding protein
LKRWVSDNTFTWLISEQILDEYNEVLARQKVRRELIGRIIQSFTCCARRSRRLVIVNRVNNDPPQKDPKTIVGSAEHAIVSTATMGEMLR